MALSPLTTEPQFDEKWAFVAEKEKNCDRSEPSNDHKGDYWDHVALTPSTGSSFPSCRGPGGPSTRGGGGGVPSAEGGRLMNLMTSDDEPAYETAILHAYGEAVRPPRPSSRAGRTPRPRRPQRGRTAMVMKRREKGRIVEVGTRVVFGTVEAVMTGLGAVEGQQAINTAFTERESVTDRRRNARKARKPYRLSKYWRHHNAVT